MFGSCRLLNYGRHAVEVAVHRAGGGKLFSLLFTPDRHELKSPASSERENNAATFLYASIAFLREFFALSLVRFSLFLRYSIMNESLRLCCSIFAFLAELQAFFRAAFLAHCRPRSRVIISSSSSPRKAKAQRIKL